MVFVRMSLHRAALSSRAGCSLGRRRPASVPRRLRPNPKSYFVILNEVKNLFPCEPKAACGLCLARRRKTNEVQSRIFFGKNLFWARLQMFRYAQHDGCSGSSQRSERQTQCSQESVYVYFYTDSSSIFRSPQNDNAVFALNHFLSGTHSSARPGRLRGSHL